MSYHYTPHNAPHGPWAFDQFVLRVQAACDDQGGQRAFAKAAGISISTLRRFLGTGSCQIGTAAAVARQANLLLDAFVEQPHPRRGGA